MASEVKVDKLSQKGSSGIVISDDIKLSSGKAIKQADGTDLLTEAGLLTPASDVKLASGTAIKNAAGTALLTQAGVLDNVSLGSGVTGGATQYVQAWINANGTSTVATNASFNATLSDLGTGNYLITFASAISDANYAAVGMGCIDDASAAVGYALGVKTTSGGIDQKTTTVLEVMSKNQSGAPADLVSVNVAILR